MRKFLSASFVLLLAAFCGAQEASPQLPVKTLDVNGATLSYVEQGSGETLILVHGWSVDYRSFTAQVASLSSNYRVIAYSQRFNHPNPRIADSSQYGMDTAVADLAALVRQAAHGPVHVAGHSRGAHLALELAARHPELVRSLVLGEPLLPALLPESERENLQGWMAFMQEGHRLYRQGDVESAARTLTEGIVGKGAWERMPAYAREMMLANLPRELDAELARPPQGPPAFDCDDARRIAAPALLVEGAATLPVFRSTTVALLRCLPRAWHAVLPATTHALQVENPAGYEAAVLEFLGRVTGAPGRRRIRVNGTELSYVERGTGEPVILLHGALHDYRSWSSQMEPLSRQYRVIAYSRRYHWPNLTSGDGADYLPATHVADLVALIRELKLGRVHLIGHSAGGNVSIRLTREHPELVRSLILGEGPSIPPPGSAPPAPPAFFAEAYDAFKRGEMERGVAIALNGAFGDSYFEKAALERRQVWMDNAASFQFTLAAAARRRPFTCEEARGVRVPTLVLVGELSPPRFQGPMQFLLDCLPAAEKATVSRAGHGLQLNNPADFARIVLAFLAKN